ncbi:hypothetical protein CCMA1212_000628 [Trichoderma ghanense]|uniref:Uncharacterized protein n=1 Tax=Trichoderma ghanense TaxID=65468 RepID=A0ABY2HEJ2_9HYPO
MPAERQVPHRTSAAGWRAVRTVLSSSSCCFGDANPAASPSLSPLLSLPSGCICKAAVQPPSGTATRAPPAAATRPPTEASPAAPSTRVSHRFPPFQVPAQPSADTQTSAIALH